MIRVATVVIDGRVTSSWLHFNCQFQGINRDRNHTMPHPFAKRVTIVSKGHLQWNKAYLELMEWMQNVLLTKIT